MAEQSTVSSRAQARYETYTGKTSEIGRTLALAGFAIAWLFSGGLTPNPDDATPLDTIDVLRNTPALYVAAVAAILALALDLLQYATSAASWGLLHWAHDQVLLNDRGAEIQLRGRAAWAILRTYGYAARLTKDRRTREHFASIAGESWKLRRSAFRSVWRELPPSDPKRVASNEVLTTWQPASVTRPSVVLWSVKLLALVVTYAALLVFLAKLA